MFLLLFSNTMSSSTEPTSIRSLLPVSRPRQRPKQWSRTQPVMILVQNNKISRLATLIPMVDRGMNRTMRRPTTKVYLPLMRTTISMVHKRTARGSSSSR